MKWPWTKEEKKPVNWADTLNATDWENYTSPRTVIPTVILTCTILAGVRVWRLYLRRIPGTGYVSPAWYRKRTLFGTVTRVGDGDNFHLYHTPGGRLTGWGLLRKVPTKAVDLKKRTVCHLLPILGRRELRANTTQIPIRIAGVDAPEAAHFGNAAQPYSKEALDWLKNYIGGRRVRCRIWSRDQYDRVVATVFIRKGLLRRDVGQEMLKAGWATVYDAKSGSEFGNKEAKYRMAEEKAQHGKRGMWGGNMKTFESPREYKRRTGKKDGMDEVGEPVEVGGILGKIFGAGKK